MSYDHNKTPNPPNAKPKKEKKDSFGNVILVQPYSTQSLLVVPFSIVTAFLVAASRP